MWIRAKVAEPAWRRVLGCRSRSRRRRRILAWRHVRAAAATATATAAAAGARPRPRLRLRVVLEEKQGVGLVVGPRTRPGQRGGGPDGREDDDDDEEYDDGEDASAGGANVAWEARRSASAAAAGAHGADANTGGRNNDDRRLRGLLRATRLGRKFLVVRVAQWVRDEAADGEFDVPQRILLRIPALAAARPRPASLLRLLPAGLAAAGGPGVNPSGHYADRVHIEHRLLIQFEYVATGATAGAAPPLPVTLHGFDAAAARRAAARVPRLARDRRLAREPVTADVAAPPAPSPMPISNKPPHAPPLGATAAQASDVTLVGGGGDDDDR
ncbi:hypothetical protein HK405_015621 [Cladochytrium tenue]|nr:hypothetical protein HK405_015621 [Cladochytrium tenue]